MKLQTARVAPDEKVAEDLPKDAEITEVCRGLKTWRNKANKFFVGRLHYEADPRKRTKEWKVDARAGVPYAEWMREYEIVWSSFAGVPVFQDHYSKTFHVSNDSLQWSMEYPIIRGWDFGLDTLGMACVFTQINSRGQLVILKELVASDSDIYVFAEAIRRFSLEWFPGCIRYFDLVDPTGFNRNAAAKGKSSYCDSLRDILKSKPIPGENSKTKRISSVVKLLDGAIQGKPKLHISGPDAPVLVEGFDGGYHYPFARDGQVKDAAEKNEYSHIHDALQMVTTRAFDLNLDEQDREIPTIASYNFGR